MQDSLADTAQPVEALRQIQVSDERSDPVMTQPICVVRVAAQADNSIAAREAARTSERDISAANNQQTPHVSSHDQTEWSSV